MRTVWIIGSLCSLVVVTNFIGAVVATQTGCTVVGAEDGGVDEGPSSSNDAASVNDEGTLEAEADATPIVDALPSDASVGFRPANIGTALGSFNASLLQDVDVTGANASVASDVDQSAAFASAKGGVIYTTVTQAGSVRVGVYIARSWRIEPNAVLTVTGSFLSRSSG